MGGRENAHVKAGPLFAGNMRGRGEAPNLLFDRHVLKNPECPVASECPKAATFGHSSAYCWKARARTFCFSSDTGKEDAVTATPCQPAPMAV
jgi:hypothetical protein